MALALRQPISLALSKPKRSKKVLLVEDEISMQCIFDSLLNDIDPRIELGCLRTAEAALKKVEEASKDFGELPFDLIVTDIFLDGMITGIDLWKICQRVYPKMPVLVISALPWQELYDFQSLAGNSPPYIQKPIKLDECRKTLKAVLQESP